MADETKFDRTPYKVTYLDLHGEKHTIKRTPPPKLHDALPTDIVRLDRKRSDDFVAGTEYEVQSISPRQPNVLQLKRSDG